MESELFSHQVLGSVSAFPGFALILIACFTVKVIGEDIVCVHCQYNLVAAFKMVSQELLCFSHHCFSYTLALHCGIHRQRSQQNGIAVFGKLQFIFPEVQREKSRSPPIVKDRNRKLLTGIPLCNPVQRE